MEERTEESDPGAPDELEWVDAEIADAECVADRDLDPLRTQALESASGKSADHEAARGALRVQAVARLRRALERRARRSAEVPSAWQRGPLDALGWCVIDLETTGPGPGGDDEILEIGAVQVNGVALGREFETLVDPRRPISRAAQRVHGIDSSQVFSAPRVEQALPWLLETTQDRVLVFHNAGFDLGFLQRALRESGREPFGQPVLDTVVLSRRALGGPCSLAALTQRLGLVASRPHRALSDARATAQLLLELLGMCREAGATTLADVPGMRSADDASRTRRRARIDPLLARLDVAVRRGETLHLTYHAHAGLAPLELRVRPRRIHGGLQLECDDELTQRRTVLDVTRIRAVHAAS